MQPLTCSARLSTKQVETHSIFEGLFRAYGLPQAIRTDHGAPFATPACCRLSALSMRWITLGIRHQRMEPGRPEQHGAHERMDHTQKAEATRPPEQNQAVQQALFNRFWVEDNEERPRTRLQTLRLQKVSPMLPVYVVIDVPGCYNGSLVRQP
jgi:putative transposase